MGHRHSGAGRKKSPHEPWEKQTLYKSRDSRDKKMTTVWEGGGGVDASRQVAAVGVEETDV